MVVVLEVCNGTACTEKEDGSSPHACEQFQLRLRVCGVASCTATVLSLFNVSFLLKDTLSGVVAPTRRKIRQVVDSSAPPAREPW